MMRNYIVKIGMLVTAAVFAISATAMATSITGSPSTSTDWTQEFCLTDCGTATNADPITKIELVMATPGVTFTSLSGPFTTASENTLVSGWTNSILNGGADALFSTNGTGETGDFFLTLGFSPTTLSTPFTFYWEEWSGSTFITTNSGATSSDIVSWSGSSWSITPMTAPVSEPGTLALLAFGLLGVALIRRRRQLLLA